MGAWIRNNFINISDETRKGVLVGGFSYKDIDDKFISEICSNDKIQVIQISKALPKEAFIKIDSILEKKPELDFRIFSITSLNRCDISFLENMPHLRRLRIDCHLRDWENGLDFNVLTKLNLKSLYLNAFDLRDYSFINHLSKDKDFNDFISDKHSIFFFAFLPNQSVFNLSYCKSHLQSNFIELPMVSAIINNSSISLDK